MQAQAGFVFLLFFYLCKASTTLLMSSSEGLISEDYCVVCGQPLGYAKVIFKSLTK